MWPGTSYLPSLGLRFFIYNNYSRIITVGFLLGSKDFISATHLACGVLQEYQSLVGIKTKIRAWKAPIPQVAFCVSPPLPAGHSSEPQWKTAAQSFQMFTCALIQLMKTWTGIEESSFQIPELVDWLSFACISNRLNWGSKVRVKTCHGVLSPLKGEKEDRGAIYLDF